jgi:hypothetical protein
MFQPESEKEVPSTTPEMELPRVTLDVGWSSPFLLIELQGERYFRSERNGNHLSTLMGFRDEMEALGLTGEPQLVEAGRIRRTDVGLRLMEGYGGSADESVDSSRVVQSIQFLREYYPDEPLDV